MDLQQAFDAGFDAVKAYVDGAIGDVERRLIALEARELVRGEKGEPGINGTDGVHGRDGSNGIDGKDGAPGECGLQGEQGHDGKNGTDGTSGKDGAPGRDGQSDLLLDVLCVRAKVANTVYQGAFHK